MKIDKIRSEKFNKKLLCLISILTIVFILPGTILAIPSGNFLYNETNLGGGLWQYDYTLYNTSDQGTDAGNDIFDLFFTFDSSSTFVVLSLPTDWVSIDGPGFSEEFSTVVGALPIGSDIAPGTSLSGFSFQFNYRAGNLPFELLLTSPSDPDNPLPYSGISASLSSPVPEASKLLMLITGFVLIFSSRLVGVFLRKGDKGDR